MNASRARKSGVNAILSVCEPRIIFVNRVYQPSTEATAQLLGDLTQGLAARGWAVHVIAAGKSAAFDNPTISIHRTGGLAQKSSSLSRLASYTHFLWQARRILAALVQPRDVVVIMTDPPLLGAWLSSVVRQRQARLVHWIQDIYPEILIKHLGKWSEALLWPLRQWRNTGWATANACVTLGAEMGRTLTQHGVAASRITLIPNWAPHELHLPPTRDEVLARRVTWGLGDRFIVAYSGNLGRVHEFATLLDAAELLRDHQSVAFVFIGAGARFSEVRDAVNAKKLTNVHFFPAASREQLPSSLAAADLQLVSINPAFASLVYPSKLAGVLAAARPVALIASPNGELADVLRKNLCGETIAPGNSARLAQFIQQCERDLRSRNSLAGAARATYEREFTLPIAVEKWEQLLQTLTNR